MNKLKLEHLAPYLPYGLDIYDMGIDDILSKLTIDNMSFVLKNLYEGSMLKIVLRPLSDLMLFKDELKKINVVFMEGEWYYLDDEQEYALGVDLELWNYNIIEKLLSWHFDIFGLIEKCLAIDINTLKD